MSRAVDRAETARDLRHEAASGTTAVSRVHRGPAARGTDVRGPYGVAVAPPAERGAWRLPETSPLPEPVHGAGREAEREALRVDVRRTALCRVPPGQWAATGYSICGSRHDVLLLRVAGDNCHNLAATVRIRNWAATAAVASDAHNTETAAGHAARAVDAEDGRVAVDDLDEHWRHIAGDHNQAVRGAASAEDSHAVPAVTAGDVRGHTERADADWDADTDRAVDTDGHSARGVVVSVHPLAVHVDHSPAVLDQAPSVVADRPPFPIAVPKWPVPLPVYVVCSCTFGK